MFLSLIFAADVDGVCVASHERCTHGPLPTEVAAEKQYASHEIFDMKGKRVSEDSVSRVIKPPHELIFIKDIVRLMTQMPEVDRRRIRKVDLSDNYIRLKGCMDLFSAIMASFPNLEVLDMSNNRVTERDTADGEEYDRFFALFEALLARPSVRVVDTRINPFATLHRSTIAKEGKGDLYKKVVADAVLDD